MNAKLKSKWLKALLSGEYKQGVNSLHEGRGYCCLGVLADIQGCRWRGGEPFLNGKPIGSTNSPTGVLKPAYAGGLSSKTQGVLANKNDGGASFKDIAEYVRTRIR